jgi:hypothetical protein
MGHYRPQDWFFASYCFLTFLPFWAWVCTPPRKGGGLGPGKALRPLVFWAISANGVNFLALGYYGELFPACQ